MEGGGLLMGVATRAEIIRQLGALVQMREQRRDELVLRLISIDSLDKRIDVLLGRLHGSR